MLKDQNMNLKLALKLPLSYFAVFSNKCFCIHIRISLKFFLSCMFVGIFQILIGEEVSVGGDFFAKK